jgi:hypothetical protein
MTTSNLPAVKRGVWPNAVMAELNRARDEALKEMESK